MSWTSRVIWEEGLFLRAQHFQQQDRWIEHGMRARLAAFGPYWWGLGELQINREALATSTFALHGASGLFASGVPFRFPDGDADPPVALRLNEQMRDTTIYLALPDPAWHSLQVGDATLGEERRFNATDFQAADTQSRQGSHDPAVLVVGRLRPRLIAGENDRAGYDCIPVARVREVMTDRRVVLDENFIPPVLTCRASSELCRFVTDLVGMLNQRSEEVAARLLGRNTRIEADQADFQLLQASNRWLPLLRHWANATVLHPLQLYETLLQITGDLLTFAEGPRRPGLYPPYRHEDLQGSFGPLMDELRRALTFITGPGVVEIPLHELQRGVRAGSLADRSVLQSSAFYLVVSSALPGEQLRRLFPAQVKIGAIEQIRELITVAVSGIAIRPMPVIPPRLRPVPGATYFELDRASPHWAQLAQSAAIAIHVSGDFPNLQLTLWAVR